MAIRTAQPLPDMTFATNWGLPVDEYAVTAAVEPATIFEWEAREEQLTKMIGELSFELEHVKYKIELARRLNDARAELARTMSAKPGEPGYAPAKYDF